MAKIKAPVLSLDAHGTLGKRITLQKSVTPHIARSMPWPANPNTLKQAYQRWNYQDYCHRYQCLTAAQKYPYEVTARKKHWTPLAVYLKQMLPDLTNLRGWWKLDDPTSSQATDSSAYNLSSLVTGTTVQAGLIDKCRYFDGIDDNIRIGTTTSLKFTTAITAEAFFRINTVPTFAVIVGKLSTIWTRIPYCLMLDDLGGLRLIWHIWVTYDWNQVSVHISTNTWYHAMGTYDGNTLKLYLNGSLVDQVALPGTIDQLSIYTRIGSRSIGGYYFPGNIDQVALWDYVADETTAKRHSERRWSAL